LERHGLIMMGRTPGGKTASVYLTAEGRQKAMQLTGGDDSGETLGKITDGVE
jgi:hypothetical protein